MYERFRESHTNEIEIKFYYVVEKKRGSHSVSIKICWNILDVGVYKVEIARKPERRKSSSKQLSRTIFFSPLIATLLNSASISS